MATEMTLERDQRDLLRGQILMYGDVGDLEIAINQAAGGDERRRTTVEQVHGMVEHASFVVSVLDQLGWDQDRIVTSTSWRSTSTGCLVGWWT